MVGLRGEIGDGERDERWGIFLVNEGGVGFVGSEKEELGLLGTCDWGMNLESERKRKESEKKKKKRGRRKA